MKRSELAMDLLKTPPVDVEVVLRIRVPAADEYGEDQVVGAVAKYVYLDKACIVIEGRSVL